MTSAAPLASDEALAVALAFDHINDEHADTVLFVARHMAADAGADAVEARLLGADTGGVTMELVGPGGPATVRFELPEPISTAADLQGHLYVVLAAARAADPDGALTSLEADLAEVPSIPVHPVEVVARRRLVPGLVEVEVRGTAALAPPAPDTFYYALVGDEPGLRTGEYTIADHQTDTSGRVRGAYYSVRHWDPATSTITFWVLVHGHDAGVSGWFENAEPGATLGLWGPRTEFDPPADADAVLLVADETGLAVVASVIEHVGPSARVVAVLETAAEGHRPPMPEHPDLAIHWIDRDGREAGEGDAFLQTVQGLGLGDDDRTWWAFGGAESRQITAVRKHVRQELGWPAERVSMTGYWRREL